MTSDDSQARGMTDAEEPLSSGPAVTQKLVAAMAKPRRRRLRRLARDKVGVISLFMVALAIAVAILAPAMAPYDPYEIDPKQTLQAPNRQHPMGTDEMGRDNLSRVIYGSRTTLGVAFAVIFAAVALGVFLGTIAGLSGGLLDEVIMRVTDIFLAVPLLVLAMAITAALGATMINAAISMVVVWWPGYARQTRAEVLRTKTALYIEAARSIGVSTPRLVLRHILPNAIEPIFVRMTTAFGYVMLTTAALSFIGLGTRPPKPDWGTMIALARRYLMSAPWYPLLVGLPLFLTAVFLALGGDAIQDALEIYFEER